MRLVTLYQRFKDNTSTVPNFELVALPQRVRPLRQSSIPVIADLNYSSTVKPSRVAMILNQADRGP